MNIEMTGVGVLGFWFKGGVQSNVQLLGDIAEDLCDALTEDNKYETEWWKGDRCVSGILPGVEGSSRWATSAAAKIPSLMPC